MKCIRCGKENRDAQNLADDMGLPHSIRPADRLCQKCWDELYGGLKKKTNLEFYWQELGYLKDMMDEDTYRLVHRHITALIHRITELEGK